MKITRAQVRRILGEMDDNVGDAELFQHPTQRYDSVVLRFPPNERYVAASGRFGALKVVIAPSGRVTKRTTS